MTPTKFKLSTNIEPFLNNMVLAYANDFHEQNMAIGKKYSLKGEECDDFNMPTKTYELIAIIDSVNGVDLNGVVMKQIAGNVGTIFSLTKNDCRLLNIEFQNNLQLFPKEFSWQLVEEKMAKCESNGVFDYVNDLSKYPIDYYCHGIKHIMLKISNCQYYSQYKEKHCIIKLPNGNFISKTYNNNKLGLTIKTKCNIAGDSINYAYISKLEEIPFVIKTSVFGKCVDNNVVDSDGNIYIELQLHKRKITNLLSNNPKRDESVIGIDPNELENKTIHDVFSFVFEGYGDFDIDINKSINSNKNRFETEKREKYENEYYDSLVRKLSENCINYSRRFNVWD